jgi:hypothetical protein
MTTNDTRLDAFNKSCRGGQKLIKSSMDVMPYATSSNSYFETSHTQ